MTTGNAVSATTRAPLELIEEAATRLFTGLTGGVSLLTVELGRRLGLYEALQQADALTSGGLAAAAGIDQRYAREWLEQQAVDGWVALSVDSDDPARRAYRLPDAIATVLLDRSSPLYTAPATTYLTALAGALPALTQAYREGTGVPDSAYVGFNEATGRWNGAIYRNALIGWLDELPDVVERLRAGGTVVDVACGYGTAAIEMARAFPRSTVVGVDVDAEAVTSAREAAAAAAVSERVSFVHSDAVSLADVKLGQADLVTVLEALHDMGDPVAALQGIRSLLGPEGVALVADEKMNDVFDVAAGPYEAMMYGMSVLHCLPATKAAGTVVDAGTVLRPPTVKAYAQAAGFASTTLLPIDFDYFHFYRMED